jgi:hypothetical protein
MQNLIIFAYCDFNITSVPSAVCATSFYSHLFGLALNFRGVRNLVVPKIGASGEYLRFIARANTTSEARTHSDEFIPSQLNRTR